MRKSSGRAVVCVVVAFVAASDAPAQERDMVRINDNVYYGKKEDPFADTSHTGVAVQSREKDAAFAVRCRAVGDNELEVVVGGREYYGDGPRPVRWRFDDDSIHTEEWGMGTEGRFASAPDSLESIIIKKAWNSKQLAVRLPDVNGTVHTHVFDLMGFREAMSMGMPCVPYVP